MSRLCANTSSQTLSPLTGSCVNNVLQSAAVRSRHRLVAVWVLESTGFRSGVFGGHRSGSKVRRSSWIVIRARWVDGTLSCWKMNMTTAIDLIAGNICWESTTSRQHNTLHQRSWVQYRHPFSTRRLTPLASCCNWTGAQQTVPRDVSLFGLRWSINLVVLWVDGGLPVKKPHRWTKSDQR